MKLLTRKQRLKKWKRCRKYVKQFVENHAARATWQQQMLRALNIYETSNSK